MKNLLVAAILVASFAFGVFGALAISSVMLGVCCAGITAVAILS